MIPELGIICSRPELIRDIPMDKLIDVISNAWTMAALGESICLLPPGDLLDVLPPSALEGLERLGASLGMRQAAPDELWHHEPHGLTFTTCDTHDDRHITRLKDQDTMVNWRSLHLVLDGRARIHQLGSKSIEISPGDVFVMSPSIPHSAEALEMDEDGPLPCSTLLIETMPAANPSLLKAAGFCQAIGLEVSWQLGATGFVTGVAVRDGGLDIDPVMASASSVLHEAGHLACIPAKYRSAARSNLAGVFSRMGNDLMQLEPDSPLSRAIIQCSDPEATAWAWAAGKHIGLPDHEIILDHEYDGEGAEIRAMLSMGQYYGINGLAHAGMAARRGSSSYPRMLKWLQDAA